MRQGKPLRGKAYLIIRDEDLLHHDEQMNKEDPMKEDWQMGEVTVVPDYGEGFQS